MNSLNNRWCRPRESNRWIAFQINRVACGGLECCVRRPSASLFCLGMTSVGGVWLAVCWARFGQSLASRNSGRLTPFLLKPDLGRSVLCLRSMELCAARSAAAGVKTRETGGPERAREDRCPVPRVHRQRQIARKAPRPRTGLDVSKTPRWTQREACPTGTDPS